MNTLLDLTLILLLLALGVLGNAACAQGYSEPRDAVVDAAGAELIRVTARAGDLRIEGRTGLSEVRV